MITPDNHDHEWFQVIVTLGNFDSQGDAERYLQFLETSAAASRQFISSEVKGSWH